MTDDFIDTGADAFGEFVIIERTWVGSVVDDKLMSHPINVVGSDSDLDQTMSKVQHFSSQQTHFPYFLNVFIFIHHHDLLVRAVHLLLGN